MDAAIEREVDSGAVRLAYREYSGPGRAIVLLHGVASNAKIWLLVAPLLASRYHVLAVDQRGHGRSDKPDSGYDFATVANDLLGFLDALDLGAPVVVGHSWGGNVAVEFAATYPERTSGIVLVDGGFMEMSAREGMTWERAEKELAPPVLTHLTPEQLIEGAKKWELGPIWSEEVEAALMGNFSVTEEGTITPNLSRENHMRVVRALWEQRPSELYRRVLCPVLFVLAERQGEGRLAEWQRMKHEAAELAQQALRDCQVLWFKDSIHDIPLQHPQELADAIDSFATRTLA